MYCFLKNYRLFRPISWAATTFAHNAQVHGGAIHGERHGLCPEKLLCFSHMLHDLHPKGTPGLTLPASYTFPSFNRERIIVLPHGFRHHALGLAQVGKLVHADNVYPQYIHLSVKGWAGQLLSSFA